MRLIDADNFLERFEKMCETETDNVIAAILRGVLINEPTAYSVDNVVEELEKAKTINVDVGYGTIYKTVRKDVAIEIVKQGGVDDDVCEWRIFDNSLTCEPQWVYETTCGKYVGEEHTSKAFVYCPYCGKKIKIVGD